VTRARTVDAIGTHCPVPVRLLADAAAKADPGALIELLADDPLAEVDVPAWCHSHGHEVSTIVRDGDVWVIAITVCTGLPPESPAEPF
jgi:tRNA 2-thiouridine synthesizing protein A